MVLINGVKYACERCIRGHRVTTCTHTDQPLMMIKPKGRPSTQCPHCKEQRRIRNSHVNCNCSKKLNNKKQHDPDCPCHVTGECTCCTKNKKLSKKKDKEKEKEKGKGKDTDIDPIPSTSEKQVKRKPTKNSTKQSSENLTSPGFKSPVSVISPSNSSSTQMNNQSSDLLNNNSLLDFITPSPQIAQSEDMNINDKDTSISSILQSWDMSSPPMGNSESLASLLSDNSNKYSKRQVGLDPLQNFRSSSITNRQPQQIQPQQLQPQQSLQTQQQRGLGEISIPVDEYIKPLNKMNVHFNNFLSTLSDTSPIDPTITSPNNSISPGQISANDFNLFNSKLTSNNTGNNISTSLSGTPVLSSNNIADDLNFTSFSGTHNTANNNKMVDVIPPTPGNGLLDIFEENIPTHKIYQNHQSLSNGSVRDTPDNEPESLFPLFPLIGPSYSQDNIDSDRPPLFSNNSNSHIVTNDSTNPSKLSHTNLHNFNMKPASSLHSHHSQQNLLQQAALNQANQAATPQLRRDITGSSLHSSNSHQSFHSIQSYTSSNTHGHHHHHHHHHHNGSHGHAHQSHFQPYPSPQPRRSNSFLSMSSSNTVASSSVGSPVSIAEQPQLLTAESPAAIQAYTGPQLSNAKTNTTLMDDIYQTKTYTDAQSIKSKRASLSGQQQSNTTRLSGPQDVNTTNNETANQQQVDPNFDMSLIGTVPITSSMFISNDNNTTTNPPQFNDPRLSLQDSIDNYDEQLFNSLLQNNS